MGQAEVTRLVSQLRINVGTSRRKIRANLNNPGYFGKLDILRTNVAALILHERIELQENRGYVTRQYAEKLISDAILYGDNHKHTMEMATWWCEHDKSAVHKLFKVLVPRFKDYTKCYTTLFHAPRKIYNLEEHDIKIGSVKGSDQLVCLELKGHPYPPLAYSNSKPNRKHIHNVLLAEAKRDLDRAN